MMFRLKMHLRLFEKVDLSSLLLSQGFLTSEGSMNPLKSYAKCWMDIYIHMYIFGGGECP